MIKYLISLLMTLTSYGQYCSTEIDRAEIRFPYDSPYWPNRTVPFIFDSNVPNGFREEIYESIERFESTCNIQFIEYSGIDFLPMAKFIYSIDRNSSNVGPGNTPSLRRLYLLNWRTSYIVDHEIIHLLGFWHEHQRIDRDNYVQFYPENVPDHLEYNFQILDHPIVGTYDMGSVMHYRAIAFAQPGTVSLAPLPAYEGTTLGNTYGMSEGDKEKLQLVYGPAIICDGTIESLIEYLDKWFTGIPRLADFNFDEEVNTEDLLEFLCCYFEN